MRIATVLAIVVCLALIAYATTIDGLFIVLFGWIPFLWRVLSEVAPDGPSVLVGVVALFLFTLGIHWLGRSFRGVWRIRWTAAVVLGVLLLFTAGISVIGITHQAAWLATSDQPLVGKGVTRRGDLRMVGIGIHQYASVHNDALPPGGTFTPEGEGLHSWETHILPYMSYSTSEIDMKRPWNAPGNERYFKCVIPEFINPTYRTPLLEDSNGFGLSHYAANSRVMSANSSRKFNRLSNGSANTILIGEVNAGYKPWGHPLNFRDPTAGLTGGIHTFGGPPKTGGTTFLMADGSVRFVRNDSDPEVLRVMSNP